MRSFTWTSRWCLQISWRLRPLCWSRLEMLEKDDSCGGSDEELRCLLTMEFTTSMNSPLQTAFWSPWKMGRLKRIVSKAPWVTQKEWNGISLHSRLRAVYLCSFYKAEPQLEGIHRAFPQRWTFHDELNQKTVGLPRSTSGETRRRRDWAGGAKWRLNSTTNKSNLDVCTDF